MSPERLRVLKNKIFDKSKWMQLPRDVVIGHDVLGQIPSICADLRLNGPVLLVTGPNTSAVAGDRVSGLLEDRHEVRRLETKAINPDVIRQVEKAASGVDFLVGVGGGRVIDTAKIVSYNIDRQFISVPTAASHDGIASSRASVPTEEGSGSLEAHPPIAIVADTGIIASAPHRLLASGCADIISNYTAILDWELAHRLRGEALSE
ncbi:MAG: iron-containing alcohol dehydrogenase, partial [Methanoregulaceae archaeon]|nr:iron-containing alcohol dehydrogenase [Methanoregulaceae archaeon]